MEINLMTNFDKTFIKNNNIDYYGKLNETRGLYKKKNNVIYINLGALQFISAYEMSVSDFTDEFVKTVIHETIHSEVNTNNTYTQEGEERVCQILSNQDYSFKI